MRPGGNAPDLEPGSCGLPHQRTRPRYACSIGLCLTASVCSPWHSGWHWQANPVRLFASSQDVLQVSLTIRRNTLWFTRLYSTNPLASRATPLSNEARTSSLFEIGPGAATRREALILMANENRAVIGFLDEPLPWPGQRLPSNNCAAASAGSKKSPQ